MRVKIKRLILFSSKRVAFERDVSGSFAFVAVSKYLLPQLPH
jgi:hypothetical protein